MKFILTIVLSILWLSAANAQLSCDDLEDLYSSLDDLAETLEEVDDIGLNSELDSTLGQLTKALSSVAYVEKDERLTRWIADLKLAWNDMEREDFEESLDDIIERLDDLGERDCRDW